MKQTVEQWGMWEITIHGPQKGNPFTDFRLQGIFTGKNEEITVDGFYDGEGMYKVRFMPSFLGEYTYRTQGNFQKLRHRGVLPSFLQAQGTMARYEWQEVFTLPMRTAHPIILWAPPAMYGLISRRRSGSRH